MVMRLLMALVLVFVSGSVLADLSCGNSTNSGNARCKQIANSNGYPDGRWNIQSKAGYPSTSMSCMGSSAAGAKYELGWFGCTGSCNNGVAPTIANGYSCDAPPDDCSTSIGTGSKDLSGNGTDGSCQCPSGKETLNAGTSSAVCADPCAFGTHRDAAGACADNCTGGFTWDASESACGCDGYAGEVNGSLTCIKASNSQLGSIDQNTADTKAGVDAIAAKQDVTNQGITNIQNQNTTIINGQAQQLSAMGATAASAASTATSSAAGAASSATTAGNTASIATSSAAGAAASAASAASNAAAAASLAAIEDKLTEEGVTNHSVTGVRQSTFLSDMTAQRDAEKESFIAWFDTAKADITSMIVPLDEGAGGCPVFGFDAGWGNIEIDICKYPEFWSIIRMVFLMMCAFLSMMILLGKKS